MGRNMLFVCVGIALAVASGCNSTKDLKKNKSYMERNISRADLNDATRFPWFSEKYNAYVPDQAITSALKKERNALSFIVFAGAWCSDTKEWLPAFYKVCDEAGIGNKSIKLVGVDEAKKAENDLQIKYKIDKVPTFIIYMHGREIGRIEESATESIEQDILAIYSPHMFPTN